MKRGQRTETPSAAANFLSLHWPAVILSALAAFLLFTNLDGEYLWSDEGDTAVLARNILQFGVPKAWDGVTFTDSDYGKRVNENLVMVSHPWLQYYITAASFAAFGETTFAARLPFAFFGWLTILFTYVLALRIAGDRRVALSAMALLVLSVQMMLLSRQCRNYSLNMLLTCVLVWQFLRLNSWRSALLFAFSGILLFHTHPVAVAPLAALGLLTLIYKPFIPLRKWFWRAAPIIAGFTIPWLFLAPAGYSENTAVLREMNKFIPRMAQFAIECASVTPLLGALFLYLFVKMRARLQRPSKTDPTPHVFVGDERRFIIVVAAILISYCFIMALTQSRAVLWMVGVRYTPAVLPLCSILAAVVILKASRADWRIWLALMLIFGFTKLARITPWSFLDEPSATFDAEEFASLHVPEEKRDFFFRTAQVSYLKSLFKRNPGTTAQICEFLKTNAAPDDILITNYGWEPLYFYTRLRQGLSILPDYDIYQLALKHQLPEYVFSPVGARWVIWRRTWGPYRGHHCDQLLQALQEAGLRVEQVASIPETIWENRENIHFRRFPGEDYKYPWYENIPDALIFRIDWPEQPPVSQSYNN